MRTRFEQQDDLLERLRLLEDPTDVSLSSIERLSIMAELLSLPEGEKTEKDKCLLSFFYLQQGESLPWDYAIFLLLAAKHGNAFASFLLGECLRLGLAPFSKDLKKAYHFLRLSHEGGFQKAGVRLLSFSGVPKDLRRKISVDFKTQDIPTLECLTLHYRFLKRKDKERECLEILLSLGVKKYLPQLLDILLFGPKKERDIPKAILLLEKAKKEGRKDILYHLGRIHLEGKGVEKDRKKAISYLLQDKHNPQSLLLLGRLKQREGSKEEAKLFYRRALDLGERKAIPLLATLEAESERAEERKRGFLALRRLSETEDSLLFPLSLAYAKRRNGLLSDSYLLKAIKAMDKRAILFALRHKRRISQAKKALSHLERLGKAKAINTRLKREVQKDKERKALALVMLRRLKRNLSIPWGESLE